MYIYKALQVPDSENLHLQSYLILNFLVLRPSVILVYLLLLFRLPFTLLGFSSVSCSTGRTLSKDHRRPVCLILEFRT